MTVNTAHSVPDASESSIPFAADVGRLLDIVANALYTNRDVFLRELISNASDACDKLRFAAISRPDLLQGAADLSIRITKDAKARTLVITDSGIGMSREELMEHLGTIARSGTRALMESVRESGGSGDLSLIGQFGVGFYSAFMVADKVSVVSRKAGESAVWHWASDGRTGFTLREASAEESAMLIAGRGTAVIVHLKVDCFDFLLDEKIEQVVKLYSDHIAVPVYVGVDAEKPANAASALWTRPKSSITEEQYREFYLHTSHGIGVDEPLVTAHWTAEGKISYTALLFVPTLRPMDLYDPTRKNLIKLFVRRVFITDSCPGLIYPWLRFLRGIVDSEDLPLNIGREMLQKNPIVDKIRSSVARRILSDLEKLGTEDPVRFATFWGQFGATLKEGLYDAYDHRSELFKVCRFRSSHSAELTTLAEYVSRMKDGQDAIYTLSGENLETLRNSPQVEGFTARGIEVLFMTDTIDDFWMQAVGDFEGKPFRSVTHGAIDLSRFPLVSSEGAATDAPETSVPAAPDRIAALLEHAKTLLSDSVGDVRASDRMTGSPVCLIAAEDEVDMHMERVLKIHQHYEPQSKRVLEINPRHPLIRQLAVMTDAPDAAAALDDALLLLLDQARIIQGEPVPDPAAFSRRMAAFVQKGLG